MRETDRFKGANFTKFNSLVLCGAPMDDPATAKGIYGTSKDDPTTAKGICSVSKDDLTTEKRNLRCLEGGSNRLEMVCGVSKGDPITTKAFAVSQWRIQSPQKGLP